MASAIFFVR